MALCSRQLFGTPREWANRLTAAAGLGVFFGLIGPFGTYGRPLTLRVACWMASFALGVALFVITVRASREAARRLDVPTWFATGAAMALAAAPFSAAVGLLFNSRYWLGGGWPARLEMYGDCLLIAAPLTLGAVLLPRLAGGGEPPVAAPAPSVVAPPSAAPRGVDLLAMLPPRLGRDLIALQMEDHYVRAHTPLGSELLLMPLAQAVDALPAVEGLRVHRSWWVARGAVQGWAWVGRNLRLRLMGGLEAPVARAQVATLRAAGWLGVDDAEGRPPAFSLEGQTIPASDAPQAVPPGESKS